jgi:hypothetical protein
MELWKSMSLTCKENEFYPKTLYYAGTTMFSLEKENLSLGSYLGSN